MNINSIAHLEEVRTFESAHLGQDEECWFALHTRSRHEKAVAEHLRARGICHLLPLYNSPRRWQDRTKVISVPLFPGYIFVRIVAASRLPVLTVPGAVRLLGYGAEPVPLSDFEVLWLKTAVDRSVLLEPHPHLKLGSRVRVRRGPLTDVEGILVRIKNQFRLVLSVDLIQSSASAEVDINDVAPAA